MTFTQCCSKVTGGRGDKYSEIKQRLLQQFLPALLGVEGDNDTHKLLACLLPLKASGLAIPNPMATAEPNWTASMVICGHLAAALQGRQDYHLADHNDIMAFGKKEVHKQSVAELEASMDAILHILPANLKRTDDRRMAFYPPLDHQLGGTLGTRIL
jgi:hypothetical protein